MRAAWGPSESLRAPLTGVDAQDRLRVAPMNSFDECSPTANIPRHGDDPSSDLTVSGNLCNMPTGSGKRLRLTPLVWSFEEGGLLCR